MLLSSFTEKPLLSIIFHCSLTKAAPSLRFRDYHRLRRHENASKRRVGRHRWPLSYLPCTGSQSGVLRSAANVTDGQNLRRRRRSRCTKNLNSHQQKLSECSYLAIVSRRPSVFRWLPARLIIYAKGWQLRTALCASPRYCLKTLCGWMYVGLGCLLFMAMHVGRRDTCW